MAKKISKEERIFIDGLIARGEAVIPDKNGNIPKTATHILNKDGTVTRIRFK